MHGVSKTAKASHFLQQDSAAAGVKRQPWATAVDFSPKYVRLVFALNDRGDRQFRPYPASAGLRVHVHGYLVRQAHFDAAAGGLEPAIPGRLVGNVGGNRTAGGDRLERSLHFSNVDVASGSLHNRFAVHLLHAERTSRGLGRGIAFHIAEVNAAAGGLDVHVAFATGDTDAAAGGASKDRPFNLPEVQAAARRLTPGLAIQIR